MVFIRIAHYPLLFNVLKDALLQTTLLNFPEISLAPGRSLIELKYLTDIVLFDDNADETQFLGYLKQQSRDVWDAFLSP